MATHSSILAWRIPRTEEAGGLQSMGSHRVGQDWAWVFMNKGGSWDTKELLQQWLSSEGMSMGNPDPALMLPPPRWPGTQRVGKPRTQGWGWTRRGKHGSHQPRDAGQAKGSSSTARQSAGNRRRLHQLDRVHTLHGFHFVFKQSEEVVMLSTLYRWKHQGS